MSPRRTTSSYDSAAISFDWRGFCDQYGIPYVTEGANVARGRINIKCPFCGANDPSEHMGLSLENSLWGCWRSSDHRGVYPSKVISALLGVSWAESKRIIQRFVDGEGPPTAIEDLRKSLDSLDDKRAKVVDGFQPIPMRSYVDTFQLIDQKGGKDSANAYNYLYSVRGLAELTDVCVREYGLRTASKGSFKQRIIFPFVDRSGGRLQVEGLTGRVFTTSRIRYYSELPKPNHLVWNSDPSYINARKPPSTLVIVEGPFDAIKFDRAGYMLGFHTVAALSAAPGQEQLITLINLALQSHYKRVFVCLDSSAKAEILNLVMAISACGKPVAPIFLPDWVKDPGAMTVGEAREFLGRFATLAD